MITLEEARELAKRLDISPDERCEMLQAQCPRTWKVRYGLYYDFFYALSKLLGNARLVEIGTYNGVSAGHFAAGSGACSVVTIDITPVCARIIEQLPFPNITAITGDSLEVADQVAALGPYDVAFIDGTHDKEPIYREYCRYRQMLKPGGLMFFDDIDHWEYPGAREAWLLVRDPKVELPELHFSGFGVCAVDPAIEVPSWEQMISPSLDD